MASYCESPVRYRSTILSKDSKTVYRPGVRVHGANAPMTSSRIPSLFRDEVQRAALGYNEAAREHQHLQRVELNALALALMGVPIGVVAIRYFESFPEISVCLLLAAVAFIFWWRLSIRARTEASSKESDCRVVRLMDLWGRGTIIIAFGGYPITVMSVDWEFWPNHLERHNLDPFSSRNYE